MPLSLPDIKSVGFDVLKGTSCHELAFGAGGNDLNGSLKPEDGSNRTADMVDEDQIAFRTEDPLHFADCSVWIRDLTKGECAHDGIECCVLKR
jgi:hypothetical protein